MYAYKYIISQMPIVKIQSETYDNLGLSDVPAGWYVILTCTGLK